VLWYWILLFACGNFTYRYRAAARDFLADPILGPALIKEATNSMKKEIQHLSENREGSQMRAESAIVAGHYSFSTAMADIKQNAPLLHSVMTGIVPTPSKSSSEQRVVTVLSLLANLWNSRSCALQKFLGLLLYRSHAHVKVFYCNNKGS